MEFMLDFFPVLGQGGAGLGALAGGLLSLGKGLLDQRAARKERRRVSDLLMGSFAMGQLASRKAKSRFLEAPEVAAGLEFLQERFADPLGGGLGTEFMNRLRAAQSIRGLAFGGSPAAQEASFITRIAEQQRARLLPQLGVLRGQAENIGERAFQRHMQLGQSLVGLPPVPTAGDLLGQVTSGALGGLQAGIGYRQFQTQDRFSELLFSALQKRLGLAEG